MSPRPQVNRSTAPRTVSPAADALWPAVKISDLGNPRLFWNTAPAGSRSSTWAQVMPATGQVTTVLDWQNQPAAPVARAVDGVDRGPGVQRDRGGHVGQRGVDAAVVVGVDLEVQVGLGTGIALLQVHIEAQHGQVRHGLVVEPAVAELHLGAGSRGPGTSGVEPERTLPERGIGRPGHEPGPHRIGREVHRPAMQRPRPDHDVNRRRRWRVGDGEGGGRALEYAVDRGGQLDQDGLAVIEGRVSQDRDHHRLGCHGIGRIEGEGAGDGPCSPGRRWPCRRRSRSAR